MALLANPTKQLKNDKLLKLPGEKTLAEAESQTGQVTSTTSPLLAQGLGATKKAAEMAQSPAHKAKVAEGAQPERTQTMSGETVAAKQTAMLERGGGQIDKLNEQLASDVATLGSIENQIPAKALEKLNTAILPQAAQITQTKVTADSPLAKDPQIRTALEQGLPVFIDEQGKLTFGSAPKIQSGLLTSEMAFSQPGTTPKTQTQAGVYLAEQGVDEAQILGSYDKTGGISEFAANQVPNEIKMDWLTPEEQAVIQRMGGDPNSTHQALQEAARRAQAKMNDVNRARAIMLNQLSSIEERAAAQKTLRNAGMTGAYTVAEKMNNLVAQIADNDTVNVGGVDMRIEEMLGDEFIQSKVAEWLDAPGLLQAAKRDPALKALAEYTERNSAAWEKLLEPVKKELDNVKSVRERNTAQASFGDKSTIPAELMDELMPGWNKLTKTGTLEAPKILQVMQMTKNPVEVKALTNLLTNALSVKSTHPDRWQKLVNMGPEELTKSGLLNGDTTWEELETVEALREEARNKVTGDPIETAANFVGAQTVAKVKETFAAFAKAGIDVTKLGDEAYAATLPDNVRAAAEKLLKKFNPDGSLNENYKAELTGGDFFSGGSDMATVNPAELEILTGNTYELAKSLETIKTSETTLANEAAAASVRWDEAEFKGRQQNWDRAATLIGKQIGAPIDYAKIQAWANRLPPVELQTMLIEAGLNPRDPQPIRALLESEKGQQALTIKLKGAGAVINTQKLKAAMDSDPAFGSRVRQYAAERASLEGTRALTSAGQEVKARKIQELEAKYALLLDKVQAVSLDIATNEPKALRSTSYSPSDWLSVMGNSIRAADRAKAPQPPDAPTFTSGR